MIQFLEREYYVWHNVMGRNNADRCEGDGEVRWGPRPVLRLLQTWTSIKDAIIAFCVFYAPDK